MNKMNVAESINRGINFFAISIFGIAGIGTLYKFIEEEDATDKTADSIFVTETLIAFIWYKYSGKALKRTLIPFYFLFAGFITKSIGLYIDQDNAAAHI